MVHVGVLSYDVVVPPEQKWEDIDNEQDGKPIQLTCCMGILHTPDVMVS